MLAQQAVRVAPARSVRGCLRLLTEGARSLQSVRNARVRRRCGRGKIDGCHNLDASACASMNTVDSADTAQLGSALAAPRPCGQIAAPGPAGKVATRLPVRVPVAGPSALLGLATATALPACGGGSAADTAPPPSATVVISDAEATRFLGQAAFGGSEIEIARVKRLGYSGWLDDQFVQPNTQTRYDWTLARAYGVVTNIDNFNGTDNAL